MKHLIKSVAFFLLLLLFSANLYANDKIMHYNILQNGKLIGQMQLNQKQSGDDLYLRLVSHVKSHFVFDILVDIEECAHFKNGQLVSSDVMRRVNGKLKANKQTRFVDNLYQTRSDNKIHWIKVPISYNLMLLYVNEPVTRSQVYSDNYQQFLEVKQTTPHTYHIALPDGNYNDYHFDNGICQKVTVHHALYTISMQLV